jgi:hypothetical protein
LLFEQITPKFRETGNIQLLIVDYGLYHLYLHTTARNVAIESYNVIDMFNDIKHVIVLGDMIKAAVYLNPWYNWMHYIGVPLHLYNFITAKKMLLQLM